MAKTSPNKNAKTEFKNIIDNMVEKQLTEKQVQPTDELQQKIDTLAKQLEQTQNNMVFNQKQIHIRQQGENLDTIKKYLECHLLANKLSKKINKKIQINEYLHPVGIDIVENTQ